MRLLSYCFGRQQILIGSLCLLVVSCSSPEERAVLSTGSEELHGSAVIIADHLIPIPEDEPQAISSPSFQRHFKRLGRIALSDSVVVGTIGFSEVDSKGRLLIVDQSGPDVFLFEPDGSFIKKLSAESCDPGFNWRPRYALFSPTDEILTVHNAPRHALFDADGKCVQTIDIRSGLSSANVFTTDREIFSFVSRRDGYYIRHLDAKGELIKRFGERDYLKNLMSRASFGGLVQDAGGRLYLTIPISSDVFVYDTSGNELDTYKISADYYREIDEDIPEGISGSEMIEAVNRIYRRSSITLSLLHLDHDKLLIWMMNYYEDAERSDRYVAFEVISTSGEVLTDESILMAQERQYFIAARDGLLYRVTDPVENENGDWGNQGLEVYQFVL